MMDWRDQHTPRGRSAEVEDSIQYLRRYLGEEEQHQQYQQEHQYKHQREQREEVENNIIEGSAQRRGISTSRGKGNEVVATGVLPAAAISGDWQTKRNVIAPTTTTTKSAGGVGGGISNSFTGGNPSWGSALSTPQRQQRERGNDMSGVSPRSDGGNYMYTESSLRNDRSALRGEKYTFTRDRDSQDTTSSLMREPLRLRYGSAAQTPVGRPPLHQHRQQQQQDDDDDQYTGTLTRRGNTVGWREDDNNKSNGNNNNNNSAPLRRDIRSTKEWEPRSSDSRWTNRDNYGSRLGGVYNDPYDDNTSSNPHHHNHRPRRHSNDKSSINDSEDEEERRTLSPSNRVITPRNGIDTGISRGTNGHSPGKRSITTEGFTGIHTRGVGGGGVGVSSSTSNNNNNVIHDDGNNVSMSPKKQQSSLKNQLTPLDKHDMSNYSSRDVFPYSSHDDNMRSIIFYLKNHYALEEQEYLRGIQTMTPEDVLGLIQCFYVDVYRTVRHARDVAGVGRAGFVDKDPNVDCVIDSPSNGEMETAYYEQQQEPQQQQQQQQHHRRSDLNSAMIERRDPPLSPQEVLSLSSATSANANMRGRRNSVRLSDGTPQRSPLHYHQSQSQLPQSQLQLPLSQSQSQQLPQSQSTRLRESRAMDSTMRPPTTRTSSHSVHWENNNYNNTPSAPHDITITNSSQHTIDTTSLSLEPPQEPRSGIVKRPLRSLMPLMRRGSTLCKHVAGSRPHLRFFRVVDQLGEDRGGRPAIIPHFAWYTNAPHNPHSNKNSNKNKNYNSHHNEDNDNNNSHYSQRPNEALSLPTLIGVHLLSAGDAASDSMRRLFRRSRGVVEDHRRRAVAAGMCAVFRFERRDVAVSFLTEADRQLWVGGMMGVVERNRELATQL